MMKSYPNKNPKKALSAILPREIDGVKPMTLGLYAALERIQSPLVTGIDPKDTLELIPSLYLLTHGGEYIFKGNLMELAFAWADTLGIDALDKIRTACEAQMKAIFDVIPENDNPKKKRTTAG